MVKGLGLGVYGLGFRAQDMGCRMNRELFRV